MQQRAGVGSTVVIKGELTAQEDLVIAGRVEGTVSVAGLGGNPYRDGSYEYYLSEKVVTNDPKGVGAFLMASTEMESDAVRAKGRVKTDSRHR